MWSGFLKPFDPQTFSLNVMPLYACHLFYIFEACLRCFHYPLFILVYILTLYVFYL
jgi:hypothetical protein